MMRNFQYLMPSAVMRMCEYFVVCLCVCSGPHVCFLIYEIIALCCTRNTYNSGQDTTENRSVGTVPVICGPATGTKPVQLASTVTVKLITQMLCQTHFQKQLHKSRRRAVIRICRHLKCVRPSYLLIKPCTVHDVMLLQNNHKHHNTHQRCRTCRLK